MSCHQEACTLASDGQYFTIRSQYFTIRDEFHPRTSLTCIDRTIKCARLNSSFYENMRFLWKLFKNINKRTFQIIINLLELLTTVVFFHKSFIKCHQYFNLHFRHGILVGKIFTKLCFLVLVKRKIPEWTQQK